MVFEQNHVLLSSQLMQVLYLFHDINKTRMVIIMLLQQHGICLFKCLGSSQRMGGLSLMWMVAPSLILGRRDLGLWSAIQMDNSYGGYYGSAGITHIGHAPWFNSV